MGEAPTITWTKLIGGSSQDAAWAISTAHDGSVYIAGSAGGGSTFDGQNINKPKENYAGDPSTKKMGDAFISKFNSDGSKSWTKLLGGDSYDYATSICTAIDGSIYIVGCTGWSGQIRGTRSFEDQTNLGSVDVFITKLQSDGSKVWTKLIGGDSYDSATSICTAFDGSIYIVGSTNGSLDGQTNSRGTVAFISKLNSNGSNVWTKLIGESSQTTIHSVKTAIDESIYITGVTDGSLDGQTISGGDNGNNDVFVMKLNRDGVKAWTRLIGGESNEYSPSIETTIDGSVYISGTTYRRSLDGVSDNGRYDAFICKFNEDGNQLWMNILGGAASQSDYGVSVNANSEGSVYITGNTNGTLDGQSNSGSIDTFITKFNSDGSKIWTSLIGGSGHDDATSASIAIDGSIYITGITNSNLDGPTNGGTDDAFIIKLNSDGSSGNTRNFTITPSATTINEGTTLTTSVATTNVASGTTLYYSLSGTGITSADFSSGALTGSGSVGSNGSFSFSHTLANDLTTEGTETLNIKLYSDSSRSTQVGSTASVSIADTSITPTPTYTLTPSTSSINEGSTLTTSIATTDVASGTTLYYSLSGTGITTADFSSGALTGSGSVASNGSFAFSHTLANDLTTEGAESLSIKLYSDSSRSTQVGSTASVSIADTSLSSKIKEVQLLSSSTTAIRYQRNKELTVPINYSTSDGSSTTGLSFKVHFNSSLLSFNSTTGVTNKTQADLFQIGATQQDTSNTDNDATTDSYIPINVASFSGQFPTAGVPVKLTDLIFKALDPITGLKDTFINFTETEAASGYGFSASSASLKPLSFSLDVDGDDNITALGDGLMIIRKMFGSAFAGDALTNKAISPNAKRTSAEIHQYIEGGINNGILDVDKDGKTTALGDGLMIIRHLFGPAFTGDALILKAISPDSPYFGNTSASSFVASAIDALRPLNT